MRKKSNKVKKINKIIFKIIKYIFILIIILLMLYSMAFNLNKLFFKQEYINLGSIAILTEDDDTSMKPEIKESDLIIVRKTKYMELGKDEIIAYRYDEKISIQRINNIKLDNGKTYYITKGDNNYYSNIEEITEEQILGKLSFKIPILGFIAKILQNQYVCLFIIILLVYILIYKLRLRKIEKRKKYSSNCEKIVLTKQHNSN